MRASCLLLVVQSSVAGSYSAGSALLRRAPIAAAAATLRSSARCSRTAAPRLAVFDAPVGAGDDRAARERALVEWLESNGVVLSADAGWGRAAHPLRVEAETVEDFELSGRGLLARKEVVQGQEIVKVPDSLILTRETAQRVLGPSIIADDLNEYLALALLLMHERSLGARSFWAPYVNILPTAEDVGQTWLWEEEDLAQLEGSGILDATDSLRAKIEREHAALLTDVITPNALDEDAFSFEAFQWAMSMLLSRAIDLRETQQLALVPYADLLNHSPYCSSYFFFNQISFSQQREVVLYADRAYAKNDQVLISYGQKSNAELLLLYGFVVDRNLFDEVEVTVSLDESDPRYDEKVTFAHRARRTTRSAHHARRSAMPPSLRGPHPGSPPRARALFLLVISPWAPDAASPDVPLLSGGLPEAPEPRAFDGLPTAHRPLLLRAAAGEFRRPCTPAPAGLSLASEPPQVAIATALCDHAIAITRFRPRRILRRRTSPISRPLTRPPSRRLAQYLRLCCLTPSDGPLDNFKYNERISVSNEAAAQRALKEGCQRTLALYPQTEAEDAALMESGRMFAALSRNQRMAVKLRRNEKRILLRTIRTCDTALDSLGTAPIAL